MLGSYQECVFIMILQGFWLLLFFFLIIIGYEMDSLSMIEKGFGYEMGSLIRTNSKTFFFLTYECVMKFMPFE